jgi:hypothetical protein
MNRYYFLALGLILGIMLVAMPFKAYQPVQKTQAVATETPFPTISPNFTPAFLGNNSDQLPVFNKLMNMPDCAPPCLWGLQPGVSQQADIYAVLQRAGFLSNLDAGGTYIFGNTNKAIGEAVGFNFSDVFTENTRVTFVVKAGVLTKIYLDVAQPIDWQSDTDSFLRLPSILSRIDDVPEIYVHTGGPGQLRTDSVLITLLYPDKGIMLDYVFDFSGEWDPNGLALRKTCPGLKQTVSLKWYFWDIKTISTAEFLQQQGGLSTIPEPTADQVLGVSAATFTEYFRTYPDKCIESVISTAY